MHPGGGRPVTGSARVTRSPTGLCGGGSKRPPQPDSPRGLRCSGGSLLSLPPPLTALLNAARAGGSPTARTRAGRSAARPSVPTLHLEAGEAARRRPRVPRGAGRATEEPGRVPRLSPGARPPACAPRTLRGRQPHLDRAAAKPTLGASGKPASCRCARNQAPRGQVQHARMRCGKQGHLGTACVSAGPRHRPLPGS